MITTAEWHGDQKHPEDVAIFRGLAIPRTSLLPCTDHQLHQ